ncbi:MAG TPA: hypothetical protein VFI03_13310 [Solirubrobacterales bacterium]|nr:hypothetical protein [Solirubrobacterales bacterium]
MKTFSAALAVVGLVLGVVSPAAAFEGGGRMPSEAPLVTPGQHYTGQLNNRSSDANYGGNVEVAFWRLPPVTTRDIVTINWHALPFTKYPGQFPICMILAQGIDDFSWGSVFGTRDYCDESGPVYELSGSGTARTQITVQETSANSSYLEFYSYANYTNPSDFETFPYDFTVEAPLHYLGLAMRPVKRVSATGVVSATANLATGLPAPDGLPFSLVVTWAGGGVASYTGLSSGGAVGFQLALPETAYGKSASFVASHGADGVYQAVTAPKLQAEVAKPKVVRTTTSACVKARRHRQALARQYKRLSRNARYARGPTRRRLKRRAHSVARQLRAARSEAQSLCNQ